MKRWLIRVVVVMLALILVVPGCAPEKPEVAGTHEIVNLEFYVLAPPGTSPHVAAVTLSEMLKEFHPWLRGTFLSTLGTEDAIHTTDALQPERRKYAILCSPSTISVTMARLGTETFKRKFDDLVWVVGGPASAWVFVTYDPEIKTPQDLIGKEIALHKRIGPPTILGTALLRDAWGIDKEVSISYHIAPNLKDLLVTKIVDVAWVAYNSPAGGKWTEWAATSYAIQIHTASETYFPPAITEEDVKRINEKQPWKTELMVIPKGALGDVGPPEDVNGLAFYYSLACWGAADEEVIYELVKFMDEYADEFTERTMGQAQGPKWLPTMLGVTEEQVHPGAMRYLKEEGIKIGV